MQSEWIEPSTETSAIWLKPAFVNARLLPFTKNVRSPMLSASMVRRSSGMIGMSSRI
ncbi:hypothetical protein QKW60_04105 [Defluviimonas aestuarii]|uniref:hypothetical protein n=1 Tax=Albidovulum aestuarii TaxID=1130726 RepID=UPI002499BE16|nr:hypothetical protein [Defluviimonas aestuarii]MDI3335580.1 hypothetical protein [Defluviimonas aestuarii]